MERGIYYYRIKNDNTVCILRCFGESSRVAVPEMVEGRPVTEIGPYCFAQNSHLTGKTYEIAVLGGSREEVEYAVTEQCGKFITEVFLPESVALLRAYAFYGCRNLSLVSVGCRLAEIENDAFMNCTSLHRLSCMGAPEEALSLKQILAQISWSVEASFLKNGSLCCRLLYPEYLEYYEDLGPAHFFTLLIEGEGYRARQCFKEGEIMLEEYDRVFPTLCAQEKAPVCARFAVNRLLYPVHLTEEAREVYSSFVQSHQKETADGILDLKAAEDSAIRTQMKELEMLFREKILGSEILDDLMQQAAKADRAELSATMIQWKKQYFAPKKKRYSFDDF